MDHYYPNSAWLCLRQDVFDRLYQYKSRQGCRPGSRPWNASSTAEQRGRRAMNRALVDQIATPSSTRATSSTPIAPR